MPSVGRSSSEEGISGCEGRKRKEGRTRAEICSPPNPHFFFAPSRRKVFGNPSHSLPLPGSRFTPPDFRPSDPPSSIPNLAACFCLIAAFANAAVAASNNPAPLLLLDGKRGIHCWKKSVSSVFLSLLVPCMNKQKTLRNAKRGIIVGDS